MAVQFFDAMIKNSDACCTTEELDSVVHDIHRFLIENGEKIAGEDGIGTTLTAARTLVDNKVILAHVGDSAAYLLNGNGLRKISKDHTLEQEILDKLKPGESIDEQDLPDYYHHTLTRCLGQDTDFSVDLVEFSLNPGDRLLICSDGITNMIEHPELEKLCLVSDDPKVCAMGMVDMANQNGGVDNSTVVCIFAT
jgi:protein phosphatase